MTDERGHDGLRRTDARTRRAASGSRSGKPPRRRAGAGGDRPPASTEPSGPGRVHLHPLQEERFQVVEGTMRFRMGRQRVVAGPGEVVVVPRGVKHDFANAADDEALVRVEVRPALKMERLFETAVELARQGRTMFGASRSRWISPCSSGSSRTRCEGFPPSGCSASSSPRSPRSPGAEVAHSRRPRWRQRDASPPQSTRDRQTTRNWRTHDRQR